MFRIASTIFMILWLQWIYNPALAQDQLTKSKKDLGIVVEKLNDSNAVLFEKLGNQIEGQPVELTFKLTNRTGKRLEGLNAKGSCACISTKFLDGNNLAPDEAMNILVVVKPSRDIVKEAVKILCSDENGVPSYVMTFAVEALSFPPLRPADYYYQISSEKPECIVRLIPASDAVKAIDISKTELTSKILEVKEAKFETGAYELKIGPKPGQTLPDKDFAAVIRTQFSIGEKTMLMEEVLTFVSNPRYEVAPHLIQLSKDRPKLGTDLNSLRGTVVVKDFVRNSRIFAAMITSRDGKVVLVDPDIISDARWIGKTNVSRMRLEATVYDSLSDADNFYIVFHGLKQPDFTASWDAFIESNDVFKVWIADIELESP